MALIVAEAKSSDCRVNGVVVYCVRGSGLGPILVSGHRRGDGVLEVDVPIGEGMYAVAVMYTVGPVEHADIIYCVPSETVDEVEHDYMRYRFTGLTPVKTVTHIPTAFTTIEDVIATLSPWPLRTVERERKQETEIPSFIDVLV